MIKRSQQKLILLAGLALLIFITVLVSEKNRQAAAPSDGRRRVVATFFPLYDFAKNVGGDKIDLKLLFTQTPEIASFTPTDIAKINQADVIIKNGAGFEPILDQLISSSDHPGLIVVDTSLGVSLMFGNPHIWLNPQNALRQVENIRDAFLKHDPANAAFYQQNAADYSLRLQALDRKFAESASQFTKKNFIAFHSAFSYLAKRYGLNQAKVIEEFPGQEPSPAYLAEVIKTIRDLKITALFSEPQFSPKVLEVIARDLGLKVRELNPLESGNPQKDSYISIMEENLQTLKEALK